MDQPLISGVGGNSDTMTNKRICEWLSQVRQLFEVNHFESRTSGSTVGIEKGQTSASFKEVETLPGSPAGTPPDEVAEDDINPQPSPTELLVGCDRDPLIPTSEEISGTFLKAQNQWRSYLAGADQLPPGCMPAVSLDAHNCIQDAPPLPQELCNKRIIWGRALWKVPDPEFVSKDDCSLELVHGVDKSFLLSMKSPTGCRISTRSDFHHFFSSSERCSEHAPNAIAIFALMWAFIISAEQLQRQKRGIQYSATTLLPVLARDLKPRSGDIVVPLKTASTRLVRWLCAILVQGQGVLMDELLVGKNRLPVEGGFPPWAAYYNGDSRFIITTTRSIEGFGSEMPPSPAEALDLLIEFCQLYPFGSQPIAGFLAALMLPFHNQEGLQPQLPKPRITGNWNKEPALSDNIRDYFNDLPYYMTLSICPRYLGSAIWSIFWEPGVQCNLVSPWLGSIHQVIQHLLVAGDMEGLAKVFALRRPRLAPLWLGMFLCGCPEVINMIESYLTTLNEQPDDGSCAQPNPNVAVWTGSHQSFLDERCSGPYQDLDAEVSRADMLRHRFNFRLGDDSIIVHHGWEPCGKIRKQDIEPELWPSLECQPRPRIYIHWIWWLARGKKPKKKIERGYRSDKPHMEFVVPELVLPKSIATIPNGLTYNVALKPSKQATFWILLDGSQMALQDQSLEDMVVPGMRQHPWMVDAY